MLQMSHEVQPWAEHILARVSSTAIAHALYWQMSHVSNPDIRCESIQYRLNAKVVTSLHKGGQFHGWTNFTYGIQSEQQTTWLA